MKSKHPRRKATMSMSTPRWLGYATAAVATATLGRVQTAEAAVDVVPVNKAFDAPNGSSSQRGMFALGAEGAEFSLVYAHSRGLGAGRVYAGGGASLRGFFGSSQHIASKLGFGQTIKPGNFTFRGTLANGFVQGGSQWQTPGKGYLGFVFTDAGGVETGWAEITVTGQTSNTFTLDEYAYSTAGESLTAGEVPEPGSLALLALGGAGLLAWRQRRAAGV